MTNQNFVERLKFIREKNGITMAEAARRLKEMYSY